jgi:CBS domain-containing protein
MDQARRIFMTLWRLCRSVVERLAAAGTRRLFVVEPETSRVEGIVSLSDVAAYLFDVF